MLVARDVRCLFRGWVGIQRLRRRSWRTAESTGGGGMNAFRGNGSPRLAWNRRMVEESFGSPNA